MAKKQTGFKKQEQTGKFQQGSGSEYHKEHASNVPDYGGNSTDQNTIAATIKNKQ